MHDKLKSLIHLLAEDIQKVELARRYYGITKNKWERKKKEKISTLRRDVLIFLVKKGYIHDAGRRKSLILNIDKVLSSWVKWMKDNKVDLEIIMGEYDLKKFLDLLKKHRSEIFIMPTMFQKDNPSLFGFINFSIALFVLRTSKYPLEDGLDYTPNKNGKDVEDYEDLVLQYNLKHFLLYLYSFFPYNIQPETFEKTFFLTNNQAYDEKHWQIYLDSFEEKNLNFLKGRTKEIITRIGELGAQHTIEFIKKLREWNGMLGGAVDRKKGNLFKYGIWVLETKEHPILKENFILFDEIRPYLRAINDIKKFFV